MSETRLRLRRPLAAALTLLAIGFAAGCSDDSGGDTDVDTTKDSPSETTSETTSTATDPPIDPATDPNGPFVVAATAVATRSIDQVVQLHVMGAGTVESNALREQIPDVASAIREELGREVADATMMTPPKGSAAASLVDALTTYRELAGQLSEWKTAGGQPMADAWFGRLERTDGRWMDALAQLSELSGTDLLANVPELMMPT